MTHFCYENKVLPVQCKRGLRNNQKGEVQEFFSICFSS